MIFTLENFTKNIVHVDHDFFNRVQTNSLKNPTYIAGPIPDNLITTAESHLGIRFPLEYRLLLGTYGAIVSEGFELAGLTPYQVTGQPFFSNVIQDTERFLKSSHNEKDKRYLCISSNGIGIFFLLDTADEVTPRIIARGPGVDDVEVSLGINDFLEQMFKDCCKERLFPIRRGNV